MQSLRLLQIDEDDNIQVSGNIVEWDPKALNKDPVPAEDCKNDGVNCALLTSIAKCVRHESNLVTDATTHTPLHTFRMVHIIQEDGETHTAQLIQVMKNKVTVGEDTNTTLLVYIVRIKSETKLVFLTKQHSSAGPTLTMEGSENWNDIPRQIMENWSKSRPMKYFLCATRMFVEMGEQIKNKSTFMDLAYKHESTKNMSMQWESGCENEMNAEQYFPMPRS